MLNAILGERDYKIFMNARITHYLKDLNRVENLNIEGLDKMIKYYNDWYKVIR